MAQMARVKMRWNGMSGAPGYSNFHFRDFPSSFPTTADAQAAVDKIDAWATGIATYVPPTVNLAVQSDVEVIEDTTGELVDVLNVTADPAHPGTASGTLNYAAAVGAVTTWRTGLVRNGRRIRGRTFLVPLSSAAFQTDGTLATTAITGISNMASALINPTGDADFGVWARPSAPGATDGVWALATGFTVPDMGAVLRSRRD